MEDSNNSIVVRNNTQRNKICKAVRDALSSKNDMPPIELNKNIELFDPILDKLGCFREQFSKSGGKCVEFEFDKNRYNEPGYGESKVKEFYSYVKTEIDLGGYHKILNATPKLTAILSKFGITSVDMLGQNETADAVIVYAEHLIARNGSIALAQHEGTMLYPSIRNLAKNIIVLSSADAIFPDLKNLLEYLKEETKVERKLDVADMKFDMLEIIRPTHVENGKQTPDNPHITIVMMVKI